MNRVLIMGLPGSGKTTLAKELSKQLQLRGKSVIWWNADWVREQYHDWDFAEEGRIRQAKRMRDLADMTECDFAICDFVAPLPAMREIFAADYTVWVDTNRYNEQYEDTKQLFITPAYYNIAVTFQDAEYWAQRIAHALVIEQVRLSDISCHTRSRNA